MSLEPKATAERLCRLLADGVGRSPELQQSLKRLHSQGYGFHIVVRGGHESETELGLELRDTSPHPADSAVFRLDSADVSFLESLGIDATRSARRRKGS